MWNTAEQKRHVTAVDQKTKNSMRSCAGGSEEGRYRQFIFSDNGTERGTGDRSRVSGSSLTHTTNLPRLIMFNDVRTRIGGEKDEEDAAQKMCPDIARLVVQVEEAFNAPPVGQQFGPVAL